MLLAPVATLARDSVRVLEGPVRSALDRAGDATCGSRRSGEQILAAPRGRDSRVDAVTNALSSQGHSTKLPNSIIVYSDVNVMWRIDPLKVGDVIAQVGKSVDEIKERMVRPYSRSVIRDVFNEISSEEYYQVAIKNKTAARAKEQLAAELLSHGIIVDMLQVHQHRFDHEYQNAINAQKQAEALSKMGGEAFVACVGAS